MISDERVSEPLSDIELADTFAGTLSGNVAEWPQLRPLLGRLATRLTAAEQRVTELEQMPCDSTTANEWMNKNAPKHVIDALWAWRRISVDGLARHKEYIAKMSDDLTNLAARCEALESLVKKWSAYCVHLGGDPQTLLTMQGLMDETEELLRREG